MKILITGAAGNLGSALVNKLLDSNHQLHLLIHKTQLSFDANNYPRVSVFIGDLAEPDSLIPACDGVDCIVHFAGVLFAPSPERFLPTTNIEYVKNLVEVAESRQVKKFVLISFPHVEGESTPDDPAEGVLTGSPNSIHAQTRLAAEKHLIERTGHSSMIPIILRPGMIYAKNVLMIEAARWLLAKRLLGVWKKPTWIHLLALPDFLSCTVAAIEGDKISGVYNLGDDAPTTLQEFLDLMADHLGYKQPWRAPEFLFPLAGALTEFGAWLVNKPAPLTRDFIRIGMVSYTSNTDRMKSELLPELAYPDIQKGLDLL